MKIHLVRFSLNTGMEMQMAIDGCNYSLSIAAFASRHCKVAFHDFFFFFLKQ